MKLVAGKPLRVAVIEGRYALLVTADELALLQEVCDTRERTDLTREAELLAQEVYDAVDGVLG